VLFRSIIADTNARIRLDPIGWDDGSVGEGVDKTTVGVDGNNVVVPAVLNSPVVGRGTGSFIDAVPASPKP